MSYRPFGSLPLTDPSAGLKYTLFAGCILIQSIASFLAVFMLLQAFKVWDRDLGRKKRLKIACAIGLLGVSIGLIDTETAIYWLKEGQTYWSITLGYFGLAGIIFIYLPCSLTHTEENKVYKQTHIISVLLTVGMFLGGLGLVAVSWFDTTPIWGVRLASFIANAAFVLIISGFAVYRCYSVIILPWVPYFRLALATLFCWTIIAFYAIESPIPLLMRFFELFGFIGISAVIFWTSSALDMMTTKKNDLDIPFAPFNG
jgi:hypothetical protein